ncbi:MAG: hypothetical protein AUK44_10690 [Porphyromonadaceae bacterium CG2_30_38_12]|nr:MAG: hypothetical protein AUK44_10690 [Porphyromonadaceae bacterium CG2_30_38_12]
MKITEYIDNKAKILYICSRIFKHQNMKTDNKNTSAAKEKAETTNKFPKVSKLWEAVEKYSGGNIIDMRAVMK